MLVVFIEAFAAIVAGWEVALEDLCRAILVELAPAGWKLTDVEDSEVFEKLASQNLSPLDFL